MSTSPVINSLRASALRYPVQSASWTPAFTTSAATWPISTIDATLKLFDPSIEPHAIKSVRPYRPQNRIFERKEELSVRILTALREAEGAALAFDAIAERIVGDRGLESVAAVMVRRVSSTALRSLVKRGVVTTPDGSDWRLHRRRRRRRAQPPCPRALRIATEICPCSLVGATVIAS
jgi:hypothetical protein